MKPQTSAKLPFTPLWLHVSIFLIHYSFSLHNKSPVQMIWSRCSFDENMFRPCFVCIQSVVLYERIVFYDCGFSRLCSSRAEVSGLQRCGWHLSRLFSWLTFIGGLLNCSGTLTDHKLTPWLGCDVCSSPGQGAQNSLCFLGWGLLHKDSCF